MIFFSSRNTFTFISSRCYSSARLLHFLQLSIACRSLQLTKQSHSQIISFGLTSNPFVTTKLITAYALCGQATQSHLVFNSNQHKNVYLYNTLISGYVKNHAYNEAFELFNVMCCSDLSPDDFTLATIAKVCGEIKDLNVGKLIHGKSIKTGFVEDIVVANSLMSMYVRCGKCQESVSLFDEMPQRNVGSWNVLISGCVNSGNFSFGKDLWEIVMDMQIDGVNFDAFTVSSLLPLCGGNDNIARKLDYGRELHCYIIRNELDISLDSDLYLDCCLIDMYSRSNNPGAGRRVFDLMKHKNVYAWTAMINGYVQNGALDEALVLFREMQVKDRIEPNKVSLVCVLPACSSLGGLTGGKQIHGFAIRKELNDDLSLCNALIDMYSKCGSLNCARQFFEDSSFHKDAISWSSIISGYGLHGKGEEAVSLYNKMLSLGNKPDTITIVGVLSACARTGLTNEGLNIYNSAINVYGIKPTIEICACVVDMLGRAGQLQRSLEFIKTMPVEPGPSVWGALVSASVIHGNSEMQDFAYKSLIQLEPENPSNYVSLSNLYASSRRWNVVAAVRTMMKDRGLKKSPGCSWISINGKTHCFCVGDKAHPCSDSIYEMLHDLILIMEGAGTCSIDLQMMTQ
ncbi:Pentatricopeptide repeat-containing protein [Melia azedarach]|uniref:Pentatricopeptide repeat-containing protein n=1 Tax=Melia azedarach TaxID=155640 RepID=A0ACC1YHX7_MELAZ|nr:Pentatricopeptide repeat-containing protein [Melia azedarach]